MKFSLFIKLIVPKIGRSLKKHLSSLQFRRRRILINDIIGELTDEIARRKRVVGIGGVDAHGHKYKIWQLFEVEVFPYKVMFRGDG